MESTAGGRNEKPDNNWELNMLPQLGKVSILLTIILNLIRR